jgi:hypothetical protein
MKMRSACNMHGLEMNMHRKVNDDMRPTARWGFMWGSDMNKIGMIVMIARRASVDALMRSSVIS